MAKRLQEHLNSQYVELASKLRPKNAVRKIVAYVESYDDVFFWRSVLQDFETEHIRFEVMLPSRFTLSKGKKAALMNKLGPSLGEFMIACVDADYDYLVQGATEISRTLLSSPFILHTYAYAIENYQCYAPSLHEVCVAVALNDHRIFDFFEYFQQYSEACFPLLVWSVWAYRTGNHNKFSLSDFNRICDPGGFTVQQPETSIANIRRKVQTKVHELQRQFPDNKEVYLKVKDDIRRLGVTPQTAYLYIQGHHLFDTVTVPILTKVCNILRQEREAEIAQARAHITQKQNEMSCYENSQQDIKAMLKKNTGYMRCPLFLRVQEDISRYLDAGGAGLDRRVAREVPVASAEPESQCTSYTAPQS